jgi:hypothetical protein
MFVSVFFCQSEVFWPSFYLFGFLDESVEAAPSNSESRKREGKDARGKQPAMKAKVEEKGDASWNFIHLEHLEYQTPGLDGNSRRIF